MRGAAREQRNFCCRAPGLEHAKRPALVAVTYSRRTSKVLLFAPMMTANGSGVIALIDFGAFSPSLRVRRPS